MIRGFIKYFLILFVFLFCAAGLVPAKQNSGPDLHPAKFTASIHSGIRSFTHQQTIITRLPLSGSGRHTNWLVADENEIKEDYLSSKKAITKYTSLGSAFAIIFQPALTTLSGLFAAFAIFPDSLSNKVYLLFQVFRI